MKISFSLLLYSCAVIGQSVLAAEEKLIADPIVEKKIRKSLKKPKGKLTESDLEKIDYLSWRLTKVTDEGVAKLKKALPKCNIAGP